MTTTPQTGPTSGQGCLIVISALGLCFGGCVAAAYLDSEGLFLLSTLAAVAVTLCALIYGLIRLVRAVFK